MPTKSKVVITRNLVHEAKLLLDARADQLEIVQWQSDLVGDTALLHIRETQVLTSEALRPIMAPRERSRSFRTARHGLRQDR